MKEELTPPFKNQVIRPYEPDGSIAKGSKDWELIPAIGKLDKGSTIVAKYTYAAFANTNLPIFWRSRVLNEWLCVES